VLLGNDLVRFADTVRDRQAHSGGIIWQNFVGHDRGSTSLGIVLASLGFLKYPSLPPSSTSTSEMTFHPELGAVAGRAGGAYWPSPLLRVRQVTISLAPQIPRLLA